MTALAKPRHEPEEPVAALLNTMLDQVEEAMRAIVAHGGEAQLRARVERLFSQPEKPADAELAAQTRRVNRIVADGEIALHLVYGIETLRRHLHRLGGANEACRLKAQTCIDTLLARLKQPSEVTP